MIFNQVQHSLLPCCHKFDTFLSNKKTQNLKKQKKALKPFSSYNSNFKKKKTT
jgi:hypothetical protein